MQSISGFVDATFEFLNLLYANVVIRKCFEIFAGISYVAERTYALVDEYLPLTEWAARVRPYAYVFLLLTVAAANCACLMTRLIARYRLENVPTLTHAAFDHRSLRRTHRRDGDSAAVSVGTFSSR